MEVVLGLNIDNVIIEEIARFRIQGGELLACGKGVCHGSEECKIVLNSYKSVVVAFEDQWVQLEVLWKIVHADQAFPFVSDGGTADHLKTVLLDLWRDLRSLGLNKVQEAAGILATADPVRILLEAATDNILLEKPLDMRHHPYRDRRRTQGDEFSTPEVLGVLEEGGLLSQAMSVYRYRNEQMEMAREVCISFEQDEYLLAEAGTGVGKTMAYLVPSIYWAVKTGNKVVISTRTRALQKQLAEKDLPLLTGVLPFTFNWQVAYGRENYLCRARWQLVRNSREELTIEEGRLMAGISTWLAGGGNGQIQDLQWDTNEALSWKKINCQRHGCGGNLCPWYNQCCFFSARRNLQMSDIIVVNHALLLSDLSSGGHILPPFQHLIVDEAHNLDRTVFDKLGASFGVEEGMRLLSRLSEKKQRIDRGYLIGLRARNPNLQEEITSAVHQIESLREIITGLYRPSVYDHPGTGTRRIRPGMDEAEELGWKCREVAGFFRTLELTLNSIAENLEGSEDEIPMGGLMGEVGELCNVLWLIGESLDRASEEDVIWIEEDSGGLTSIAVGPLDVGHELNRRLYPNLRSLILVSATLTVGDKFDFIKNQLGLYLIDNDRIREWATPSPYDYANNCRTLAVSNLVEPGSVRYAQMVADVVHTIAQNINKRALVLFTSRSLLLQTAGLLERAPLVSGRLISQYQDGDFNALMSRFRQNPEGILLGSDTFWEGVDLPGEMLNCLVLTRLPFRPPSEPLAEAWVEYLNRQGKNGFVEYSLAEAVVRFRQGVGRLIRSETDTGVLVILDRRFCRPPIGRPYSRLFRHSMPNHTIHEIKHESLESELLDWFGRPN